MTDQAVPQGDEKPLEMVVGTHGVVIVYEHYMSPGNRDLIRERLRTVFGGREVVVLDGGPRIYDRPGDQLLERVLHRLDQFDARMEAIVSLLEQASADEPDTEGQALDLEGHSIGRARDITRPL